MAYKWLSSQKDTFNKNTFLAKCDCFLVTYASILNPDEEENVHAHATTKEMKKKYLQ